ncbi:MULTISPECIES: hypothetical protein [Sphingomonas]|uniref:hypothetical protein n=1 Tax=Sphingomonas TaxID=13687 RepID=UPI0008320DFC|nr:hypothetical protein [Sphingomonas sp. CCH10-B3]
MTPQVSGTAGALLALTMLGAFACAIGGGLMIAQGRDRRKGTLLLVMAIVLVGNVLVLTM